MQRPLFYNTDMEENIPKLMLRILWEPFIPGNPFLSFFLQKMTFLLN